MSKAFRACFVFVVLVMMSTPLRAQSGVRRVIEPELGTVAVIVDDLPLVHSAQHIGALDLIDSLKSLVESAGGDPARVVKLHVVSTDAATAQQARARIDEIFPADRRPAVSLVAGSLPVADAQIGVDFVAVAQAGAKAEAPPSGKWFGQRAATLPPGGALYVSGQAEQGASPVEATTKTIATLLQTLNRAGARTIDVVQAKCFLTPITAADDVAAEFERAFGEHGVPLVFVEWKSDRPIEIELIAQKPTPTGEPPRIEFIPPANAKPSPLFAHATRVHSPATIYVSSLTSSAAGDGEAQTTAIFEQLREVLEQNGSDLKHLAKATYYVSDADASQKLNAVRPRYYDPERPPAASKAMVPGTGVKDRTISIDMIAVPRE